MPFVPWNSRRRWRATMLMRANPIERHIRDARSGRVQAPQADAAHVAAGRSVLLTGSDK
jgi:hypothetical protein